MDINIVINSKYNIEYRCKTSAAQNSIPDMTVTEFRDILSFIDKTESNEYVALHILGGEPSLHPDFKAIISILKTFIIKNEHWRAYIYTDGISINHYLKDLTHQDIIIILYVISPYKMNQKQQENFAACISILEKNDAFPLKPDSRRTNNTIIYCNFFELWEINDFLWDFLQSHHVPGIIVGAQPLPDTPADKSFIETYYHEFMRFMLVIHGLHLSAIFGCSVFPICSFNVSDLALMLEIYDEGKFVLSHCAHSLSFYGQGNVTSCLYASGYNDISQHYEEFNSVRELANCISWKHLEQLNKCESEKCTGCAHHQTRCVGSCLGYN